MSKNKIVALDEMRILAEYAKAYTDKKFAQLEKRFDVLSNEYCIHKSIEDSNGRTITDHNHSDITGKVVYSIK